MSGTSAKSGYLSPLTIAGAPPYDQALEDIVHDILTGISGLPPQYVRPFYQPEPPAQPAPSIDWAAFNMSAWGATQWPAVTQYGPTAGDTQSQHEDIDILFSFFGPNAAANMARVRSGLYIAQNRDMIKAAGLNVVDVGRPVKLPELTNLQFINRVDLPITLRRKIALTYNVQPLDTAQLTGNPKVKSDQEGLGT